VGLDREQVSSRLAASCPPIDTEHLLRDPGVPASVLIGLVGHPQGPNVILTRRQQNLKNHPNEVSFPGGKIEPADGHPWVAALREASEEIGLAKESVHLLGCLPPYLTVSGFRVYPFVGWIEPPVNIVPDPREVAEAFELPLDFVLDPANHERGHASVGEKSRDFYVLSYSGHRIWGATADILVELARVLS